MSVPIALTLLVLCAAKVHCDQDSPACPRKESYPGVLTLNVGSEVILGCRGDVTVDSVSLVMSTKHKERLGRRGDVTSHLKSQKARESPGTTGIHNLQTENFATNGKHKLQTATGVYAKVSESVTTANMAISSAKVQMGSGQGLQAVNQSTKPNSVGRVTEEGGAFSITLEMGLSTERSTTTEYEEDEDYDEKVEGLRVTRSIKRQARWTRNGQLMRERLEIGGALRLPALRLTDSGNYSCYRRGKLVSSVKISVGIPPERPTLSCYKKSHISKIRCEWISRQPIIPQPQCYMFLRKGLEKISRVNCSYSVKHSRCWCALPSEGIDRRSYTAQLCVTNTAGNATSSPYNYIPQNIIKPDPPARVVVKSVKGEPHTLKVSWSLPATWKQSFYYILSYQLRYRPEHAKEYQQVDIEDAELFWLISDALSHVRYEVQIRAKDEYDGQWSDWTRSVYNYTWTAPETTVAPDINTSLGPMWIFPEGSGGLEDEVEIRPAADGDGVMWVNVMCIVGVCLLFTFIIISVYSLRNRMPLMSKKKKESVSSACSCSSPTPLLQQPLMTQRSNLQEGEGEGIYLHNVDYFFSPSESYRS
ncbi:interleukin-6 receptor subunit alpha [Ictalurus punctatus]|uniref:Interleukin-6 receptor subunit alpha n=1 Tax=Ictalurus punctatus TaxID=7998 RepID=W5UB55_ICTPU|nr:interleukin-6 receptor subunit alpha [Ictalurus punctatus]